MERLNKLKLLLDNQYEWPCPYTFKFIVPAHQVLEVSNLLDDHELETKSSKTGKYISVTATKTFDHSDHVIDVYTRVSQVQGLISL